ncbi:MAG TPA: hypothetical protein VL961_10895, partial [Acidimicrobiales bacterium]|nr:hypothetical protein [Acidimicrobiales bacterium]
VERYNADDVTGAGYGTLNALTSREAASVSVYDTSSSAFPLLDVANHFALAGASFPPSILAGLSQTQIAGDLAYAASPVTEAVVASANEITAAICAVTDQNPDAACEARGVLAADQKMGLQKAG